MSYTYNTKFHKEAERFNQLFYLYGMQKDWLYKTFKVGESEYRFVGLDTKNSKNVCILSTLDEKSCYKTTVETIKNMLK